MSTNHCSDNDRGAQDLGQVQNEVKQALDVLSGGLGWEQATLAVGDVRFTGRGLDMIHHVMPVRDLYFCVGRLRRGETRRLVQNVEAVTCFVLDDLGTKADLDTAIGRVGTPTMLIETSPGNFSGLWVYDTPVRDPRIHVALMKAAADQGLTDPAVKDVARLMRLPAGSNNKDSAKAKNGGEPWPVRLDGWGRYDLSVRVRVDDLAAVLGVDLSEDALVDVSVRASMDKGTADLSDKDEWLAALDALGWVLGEGSAPGKVDILCPFVGEHSVRVDTGTAYLGGGRFKCHHGACAERRIPDFQRAICEALDENGEGGQNFLARAVFGKHPLDPEHIRRSKAAGEARAAAERDAENLLFDDWVWIEGTKQFAHRALDRKLDTDGFNLEASGVLGLYGMTGKNAGSAVFKRDPRATRVDFPTYLPGAPRVCPVPWDDSGVLRAFNDWRPQRDFTPERVVTDADVSPWLDHLDYLVPDDVERRYLLYWMGTVAQRPGEKIQWAYVLQGEQGTGKDTLFKPLWSLVGARNVREVTPEQLASSFTDWAKAQVIVLQELARSERFDVMNKLKVFLASTAQAMTWVNEKNLRPYPVLNLANFLVLTNNDDALAIDETDRRFMVCCSPAKPKDGAYYEWLHDWLTLMDGAELVAGWLLNLDLDRLAVSSTAAPPRTQSKRTMIRQGKSGPVSMILMELEEGCLSGRALLRSKDVVAAMKREHSLRVTDKQVIEALRAHGSTRWREDQDKPRVRFKDGTRGAVWIVEAAKAGLFNQMDESQIADKYEADAAGGGPRSVFS